MGESIKISSLSDTQIKQLIKFYENKKRKLEGLIEEDDGYPFGYTETLLRIATLKKEMNRRKNEQ